MKSNSPVGLAAGDSPGERDGPSEEGPGAGIGAPDAADKEKK